MTILQTNTVLQENEGVFVLISSYSGGVNPNITFQVEIIVTDVFLQPIGNAKIIIEGVEYFTDVNGSFVGDFTRKNYTATIEKPSYLSDSIIFTVYDSNVTESVILQSVGSFNLDFNDDFQN